MAKTKNIKFEIKVKVIWDHLTECYVMYCKKYNISGYGPTKKAAKKMLIFSVLEILDYTKPNKNKDDKSRKNSSRKLQKVK